MPSIAIQFARLGPYHLARIDSAVEALADTEWEVIGLETAGTDATYAWKKETRKQSWTRHTVFPDAEWESIPRRTIKSEYTKALDELHPDAVAISGWGSPDARACLSWCRRNGVNAIVMSETREGDGQRTWWKELIKHHLVSQFDAALVGGKSHRDYLIKLGISVDRIEFGYNVVNNHFFSEAAHQYRKADAQFSIRPYFLASNRFIERKNLSRLIEAYGRCAQKTEKLKAGNAEIETWNLCLLGDGELKEELMGHCRELGLEVKECAPWEDSDSSNIQNPESKIVYFPGFRQIDELPRFYAHAGCFVHPALEEPWGLVLNEAMACGLPILSSNNVGAAEELVDEGVNGWKFDARDEEALAEAMRKVSSLDEGQSRMMEVATKRILEEKCPTEAFGWGLVELLEKTSEKKLANERT